MSVYGSGEIVSAATTSGAGAHSVTKNKTISNPSSAAAVFLQLPAASSVNDYTDYVIKDGKGDAGSNNITITTAGGTIDGSANTTISSNYGALVFTSDGTNWHII